MWPVTPLNCIFLAFVPLLLLCFMYAQNEVQVDSRCPSASSSLHLISHHKFSTGNRNHYHYLKVKSQYKMLMWEISSRWRKEELGPLLLRGEPSVTQMLRVRTRGCPSVLCCSAAGLKAKQRLKRHSKDRTERLWQKQTTLHWKAFQSLRNPDLLILSSLLVSTGWTSNLMKDISRVPAASKRSDVCLIQSFAM